MTSDLDLAQQLADVADSITTARFRARDLGVDRKPDRTPVTDADLAVEDAVRDVLAEHRPGDVVAGEERGGTTGDGRAWVLDPIDGTKNFLRGGSVWATLIALVDGGEPVAAVVSAPALRRRWHAATGTGAWLGDQRLRVSAVGSLDDAWLSTTDLGSWAEYHSQRAYLDLVTECWESRAYGDFWQHCLVAEGVIDLAAEPIANEWDLAAVQLLVTEAGGRFTDLSGAPGFAGGSALASNGLVHDAALDVLRRDMQ